MSQYKTGTATVTNNSATVTGTNTLWLANVTAGDSFTVAGDGVMYYVASVDTDTQVTLSAPYAGTTASGAVYAIGTGFTVPDSFPEMSQGDIETATIFTRAMRGIQGKFSSILAGGANANFTAMPQVGGNPIVESGSNSDGEWTRWADGTQICIGDSVANGDTWKTSPFHQINFPVSFIGGYAPINPGGGYSLSLQFGTDDGLYTTSAVVDFTYNQTHSFRVRPQLGFTDSGTSIQFGFIAIGRWK